MGSRGTDHNGMGTLDVAIIGGGIAGLTVALGLINRGVRTTVYERSANFREIGAGIGFTNNAEWAMKVLDPRIHSAFKRVTVQNGTDWFIWMDGASDEEGVKALIHKMYLGKRGFEGCARADFLDEVAKIMPAGSVQFSKDLVGIMDRDDGLGKVELKFADGSSVSADVVIGCDGIRSKLRKHVVGDANESAHHARYTHKYAFRALVPMDTALAALGPEKTDTRHMYLGPDGHALTFPVAEGKLLNVVAFVTDPEEWPHPDKFTAPASKADAVRSFQRFNSTVRAIIDMLPDELSKWAVFDTYDHPAPTFVRGRVCISGDAAHASTPYHGAGAGCAIEDGAVIAYLLSAVNGHHASTTPQGSALLIRKALKVYDAVRLERAHWLVETSRFVGNMYQWQDPVVGSDHVKCAEEIDWRCRRIWHYDIDAMMADTKQRFEKEIQGVV